MSSITHIAPAAFTDPNKVKLYLDPVMNKGSAFLFDFLNPASNPSPDGPLANGATFKNLVDGGGDGVFTPSPNGGPSGGAIVVSNVPGKAGLISAGQIGNMTGTSNVSLGGPQPTADKPFMVSLWLKQSPTLYLPGAIMSDILPVAGATGSTLWDWAFYAFEAGKVQATQRVQGSTAVGPGSLPVNTAVKQVALSWSAGVLSVYSNGAFVASAAGAPSPLGPSGVSPTLTFTIGGTYYRAYMERLDLSGRSALAAVQAEYAANNGRFA